MSTAIDLLVTKLDDLKAQHQAGINPSRDEIAELFELHAEVKAQRVDDTRDPRGRELTSDEAAQALSDAFVRATNDSPSLDEVDRRLQRAVAEQTARKRKAGTRRRTRRVPARPSRRAS